LPYFAANHSIGIGAGLTQRHVFAIYSDTRLTHLIPTAALAAAPLGQLLSRGANKGFDSPWA
jgi:hypothetical protein